MEGFFEWMDKKDSSSSNYLRENKSAVIRLIRSYLKENIKY